MVAEVVCRLITGVPALTVSVAVCIALPHAPVVVTMTVWLPGCSEPVGMVMFGLFPPTGLPSRVHA